MYLSIVEAVFNKDLTCSDANDNIRYAQNHSLR